MIVLVAQALAGNLAVQRGNGGGRLGLVDACRMAFGQPELGEGGYFGEMSMLLDAPRTATAEGGPDGAELVEVARGNFDVLLRENPEIVQRLLRELADRLRRTNEQLR